MLYSRYANSIDLYDIVESFQSARLSVYVVNDNVPLISADKYASKLPSKTACQFELYPNSQVFVKSYSNCVLVLKPVDCQRLTVNCSISDVTVTAGCVMIDRLDKLHLRLSQRATNAYMPDVVCQSTTSLVFRMDLIKSATVPGYAKAFELARLKHLICLGASSKPSNCFILSNPQCVPASCSLSLNFALESHSSNITKEHLNKLKHYRINSVMLKLTPQTTASMVARYMKWVAD